jgi:acyl-CoA thioesterase-1
METTIEDRATVLFQGDSITDAGRGALDPENLGSGYAMMAASWFSAAFPEKEVTFLNRGIGGNRAIDMENRWERDCIDLTPSWVSIMIGINDTWRAFDSGDPTSSEAYEASLRTILTRTRDALAAQLILVEPFVLPYPEDRLAWRTDLDPRIRIVRAFADEFNALLVPLDGIMNAAAEKRPPSFWAPDGVHPTPAGHALIAQSWLRAVKALA